MVLPLVSLLDYYKQSVVINNSPIFLSWWYPEPILPSYAIDKKVVYYRMEHIIDVQSSQQSVSKESALGQILPASHLFCPK